MAKPVRLQLSRKKGFDLQAHSLAVNGLPAVKVSRPGKWGNPFAIVNEIDRPRVVENFRKLFISRPSRLRHMILQVSRGNGGRGEGAVMDMRTSLHELRGKNLACWCRADQPCHADVLLKLANGFRRNPARSAGIKVVEVKG